MNKQELKLYYTSDLHGFFYPTTYGDKLDKEMGLFKCCAQFERDENTLYLDGGDILQGSAYAYYCKQKVNSSTHIAEIMNAAGCDFYTIGNHDFNYGIDYLKEYIHNTKGRCVCQNLTDLKGNVLYPYRIKEMPNGLRVGITGIVTDYVNVWERPENLIGVHITEAFTAAKTALEEMKEKCDITICIYHGGFECDLQTGKRVSDSTENAGYRICKELDFDVLLTGHQHMHIPGQYVEGTYTLQPVENGVEAYAIHICKKEQLNMESMVIQPSKHKNVELLYAMKRQFIQMQRDVQKWLELPIGHLDRDFLPDDRAKMAYEGSDIARLLNQVQLYYSKAQISAVGLANDVAGFRKEVKTRDIIATYPYPNTLVVLEITGAKLKEVMERSAEYLELMPDRTLQVAQSFLVPKVEHYNYDYYAGVTYVIHPENEKGNRICNLSFEGKRVKADDKYTICINNYRATGAGGYPAYKSCPVVKTINVEMVEMIMDYFATFPHVHLEG